MERQRFLIIHKEQIYNYVTGTDKLKEYLTPRDRLVCLTHLNDGIRVSGEHFPLEGHNLIVIFALYAVQCHAVLRLDHPIQASVGHRWTVGFIWREAVVLM